MIEFTIDDIQHCYGIVEGKTGRIRPGYWEYLVFPFELEEWEKIKQRILDDPIVRKYYQGNLPDSILEFLTDEESAQVFSIDDPDYSFDEVDYKNYDEVQEKLHNKLFDESILDNAKTRYQMILDGEYGIENEDEYELSCH